MQGIEQLDKDLFRFTVTHLMGSLIGRFSIDTTTPQSTQRGINSMADMATTMAQAMLSRTEESSVLVLSRDHPVMAAITGFHQLAGEIGELVRPELAEGELHDAAMALVNDNPASWYLDEIGIPMPGEADTTSLGRPLTLCKAAALLLLEAVRVQQAMDADAADGQQVAAEIAEVAAGAQQALADGTLVAAGSDTPQ